MNQNTLDFQTDQNLQENLNVSINHSPSYQNEQVFNPNQNQNQIQQQIYINPQNIQMNQPQYPGFPNLPPQMYMQNIQVPHRVHQTQPRQPKYSRDLPIENPYNLQIEGSYQTILYNCGECLGCCLQWVCCCCDNPNVTIEKSKKGIFERFGKYVKTVEEGFHFVNPCTDSLYVIDCRTQNIDLSKQWAITKDNILVSIDGVVQFRIGECRKAHYSLHNVNQAMNEISISAIRSVVGHFTFQELLDKRREVQNQIEDIVYSHIDEWGIIIEQIVIKDINMESFISNQLEAASKEVRLAQAKILNAKVDVESAKQQRIAADYMNSKAAMQIRYLSTLEKISGRSKIVFMAEQ